MNDRRSGSEIESKDQVSRDDVRDYYSKAAVTAQESLCCPVSYNPDDLSHIPKEVLEISYGCGSPVNRAGIRSGDSMVDLGSGGGIDCFIAAKMVGPEGKVTGIDMTEEMLGVARTNSKQVIENLGYNNIDFKQGFLENIPVDDASVNVVTSNCVVNLSTRKQEVFKEIFRILKPGGRFVIADIISDRPVPEAMRSNRELWGECISGAVTVGEFLNYARQEDFYGFSVVEDYLWKVVEGIKFYSYILTGYKPVSNEASCCPSMLTAIYAGPFANVTCENLVFPVGVPVQVDEDLADRLSRPPYQGLFNIIDPENEQIKESEDSCCG